MKWIVTESYDESCKIVAEIIRDIVKEKPDAKLGLATGDTPVPIYRSLVEMNRAGQVDFSRVHTVNLDEYCGLPPEHPQSYRYFMDHHLFQHINIPQENTFVAAGCGNEERNAAELEEKVFAGGAPDLQLLGVGNNGHIAFNEAGDTATAASHVETLTQETIASNARFFDCAEDVPTRAITMGMGGILAAKRIVLVATGAAKREAIRGLYADDAITTHNPATFLKLHHDATVIIDRELAELVGI